jgi:phenylacetate-CoA ligase
VGWYSALLERTLFPLVLRRDNRQSALGHWRFLEQSQYWSRERLQEYQNEKLRQLLTHAYQSCPYYTRLFDERNLKPDSFHGPEDLVLLPVLTKDLVYDNGDDIISTKFNQADLKKFSSGGTTGQQTTMFIDNESYNIKLASAWRFEHWMGMTPCDKQAIFWPAAMDFEESPGIKTRIKDRFILRKLLVYIGASSEAQMLEFYEEMVKFKPKFLKFFPSPVMNFVDLLRKNSLPVPTLTGIMSTGEPLYDDVRTYLEETFHCTIYDMYGSREVGNTSSQCNEHNGLHVAMETSVVEFLENGVPVKPGERGEIFITDLTNYGFPLIRYQISDYGRSIDEPCACGRGLTRMSAGVGRVSDDFLDASGRSHSAYVLVAHIPAELSHRIGQIQIVQRSLLDLLVRMTRKPEPTPETFQFVESRLKKLIGEAIRVEFELVDKIPPERSGKTRFFICLVDQETGVSGQPDGS